MATESNVEEVKPRSGADIQREREAEELANHMERLPWLESAHPCWSCGTPVDVHTRNVMLRQSREAIAAAKAKQ